MPSLPLAGPWWLLLATAATGICSAVAFGSSYQMVAMGFPEVDSAALTTGFVAGAPLVLAIQTLLGIGPAASGQQLAWLFYSCAVVTLVGGIAAGAVLRSLWLDEGRRQQTPEEGRLLEPSSSYSSLGNESSFGSESSSSNNNNKSYRNPLLSNESAAPSIELEPPTSSRRCSSDSGKSSGESAAGALSLGVIGESGPQRIDLERGMHGCHDGCHAAGGSGLWSLWPTAAALALSIFSSQLLFPFFSFARSAESSWPRFGPLLPQVRA